MALGILGRKVEMTQIYDESGKVVPVTVIQAGPCHVLQVRTRERDGYEAVQLGFEDIPRHRASRSRRGHVAQLDSKRSRKRGKSVVDAAPKAGCEPQRFIREIRGAAGDLQVGAQVDITAFTEIKAVDVTGTSKGRGFSGAMKRHNFSGQRATHGVKKCHRHLGGTGCSASPSRVIKGKKMPGHYGAARSTCRNLKIVRIDPEHHLLLVRGAVPGPSGGFLVISATNIM
jgi:large subunit ribosomal protein L3